MINRRETTLQVSDRLWVSDYLLAITPSSEIFDFINSIKKELYVHIGSFKMRKKLPCIELLSLTANSAYSTKLITALRDTVSVHQKFELSLGKIIVDFSNQTISIAVEDKSSLSALSDSMFMKLYDGCNVRQTEKAIVIASELTVEQLVLAQDVFKGRNYEKSFEVTSVTLFKRFTEMSMQALHDFKL